MISAHRRFSVAHVTVGGVPVGGATIDSWRDAGGERWCARLLLPIAPPMGDGILEGTKADGTRVRGEVRLGDTRAGPTRGRHVMAELLGQGPLQVADDVP